MEIWGEFTFSQATPRPSHSLLREVLEASESSRATTLLWVGGAEGRSSEMPCALGLRVGGAGRCGCRPSPPPVLVAAGCLRAAFEKQPTFQTSSLPKPSPVGIP